MIWTMSTEDRVDRRAAQVNTIQRAHRMSQPWTAEDDHYLLTGPGSVSARAKALGRTYYAACARLTQLRRAGVRP